MVIFINVQVVLRVVTYPNSGGVQVAAILVVQDNIRTKTVNKVAVRYALQVFIKRAKTQANVMLVQQVNTKIKMVKPVVKIAIPGSSPTLLEQDAPDVIQVNTTAVEVAKIVKVDNTKINPIRVPVKIVLLVNIQVLVEQKFVMLV